MHSESNLALGNDFYGSKENDLNSIHEWNSVLLDLEAF